MNLTALAFLAIYFGLLFLAFYRHPIFGLTAYLWAFYNPPAARWWGYQLYQLLPGVRYALLASIFTFILALAHSSTKKDFPPWFKNGSAKILIVFLGWMWIQSFWAVDSNEHWEGCILFSKYLLLYYLIYCLVDEIQYFELFLLFNCMGSFIFGWEAYTRTGVGRLEKIGGPGIEDANSLSMHLGVMTLLAGFLFLVLKDNRKWIVAGCLPFILNGIILALSRAAFLGIACGIVFGVVLMPARKRIILYGVGVLGVCLFLFLAHDQFWERMMTILPNEEGQLEGSAHSRLPVLEAGWEMAKDHPMGVGFGGHGKLSKLYLPPHFLSEDGTRSAHHTGMDVLVEHGFFGAFLYLFLWGWIIRTLWKLKSLDQLGLKDSLGIFRAGLGAALVVFLVTGLFHNFFRAEMSIWLFALVSSFSIICHQSIQRKTGDCLVKKD